MTIDKFKNDFAETLEQALKQTLLDIEVSLDDMFLNCFDAQGLGQAIWQKDASPLINAIDEGIFREGFNEIFTAFIVGGSFYNYIYVFKKIFSDSVQITFTISAPGKLIIDIIASEIELFDYLMRYIQDGKYKFDELVDYDGDNIVGQMVKGFQSEYELKQMLFELVPNGVFTNISLTRSS